ncbi:ABC transporter substrate-binding protein [Kitasatospora sp. NPDC048365]|uniref:ABC transporter substrate-binding protein n=1 Tax=Kitasatospora sp. NPDC048365 TaxID=3364050 RepID=UPI0037243C8E
MHRRIVAAAAVALTGVLALSACSSSGSGSDAKAASGPVTLNFWSWAPNMDKVAAVWNASHPDIQINVLKQAGGDDLVTKVITAAKAGNAPDLIQTEYQALPTLVSNDVLADVAKQAGSVKDRFADGVWKQVTLGTDAVYAIPQDSAPLAFYYRQDLFQQYGLKVPTTWAEFADAAHQLKAKDPAKSLTTFSSNDSGLFAGLAQQAGAKWWTSSGDTWKVAIDDTATKKVADFWGGLVKDGSVDNQPMYTPAWSKALNEGTQIAWVSAVWAPGVLESSAPDTKGKWAMAPLPQWNAGENATGSWGGSSTGITTGAVKAGHADAAAKFATWLNTDPAAVAALVKEVNIYPAATAAQATLTTAPAFFPNQADFYAKAAEIAKGTAPAAWGPNVNVAYSAFKDAFGQASQAKSDFAPALTAMQTATVDDMKKNGFKLAG